MDTIRGVYVHLSDLEQIVPHANSIDNKSLHMGFCF